MSIKKLYKGLIIYFIIFLSACQNTLDPDEDRLGYDFFPIQLGHFIVYDVEEITYTVIEDPVIERYQLRELILEEITDIDGERAFRLERARRNNILENWGNEIFWQTKRNTTQAIRIEDNLPFIRLVFPTEDGVTWDGNAQNGEENQTYTIQDFDRRFELDGQNYSRTLKVIQSDVCSLVELNRQMEVYSRDIGLIYKQDWQVVFKPSQIPNNTFCENENVFEKPDEFLIESGKVITYKIIEHGQL